MNKVLVIAPHADDEVLGCGGTIAKMIRLGHEVHVAVLTNASVGAPEIFSRNTIELIRREAIESHRVLKVTQTHFFDLPAPQLEQFPQYRLANCIQEILALVQPQSLYIPHKGDLHLDHASVYNAALVAARPFKGQVVRNIYAYETPSETEWGHPTSDHAFIPTRFQVLSRMDVEGKIQAMAKYVSQLKEFPHPRSLETIRHLAALRGSTIGVESAEGFMVIREIVNQDAAIS